MKWEKVGTMCVDAGLCWIGDPCYVVSKDASHAWETWDAFCDELFAHPDYKSDACQMVPGVVVSTGYGDGEYDVFVKRRDGRIAEAKVVFITDEECSR